ncbi:DUF4023 domain-containing protein [Paenibacillus oleatilyticus]|uniref:DUF4023 domain-containing protein n=1 Tax=Paenibacillus oleatilyticus TaxID=2594886 RepID=A0ABV4UWF4_9BACL|nr:DUF4023 domain-containing protein [Paenibacillus oleatilyticus]MBU7320884.1 DUF4023 domain-containing protein [Paenibacillus oleatilyticus]
MRDDLTGGTEAWLNKLHETQEKDEKNREHQGKGHPGKQLPTKRKSNQD